MKKKWLVTLFLLMAFMFTACGTSQPKTTENAGTTENANTQIEEPSGFPYTFTDALDRSVTVKAVPQHVVALMGSFAETWLNAGGTLVGVTDDVYDERGIDPGAEAESVGFYNSPSVEQIIALDPDFVILSAATSAHVELKDTLEAAGINCAYFNVTYFEDYLNMLQICCDLNDNEDAYTTYGSDVQEDVEAIKATVPEGETPNVLLLITYSGGAKVKGSDNFMTGRMLQEMGCVNIADENPSLLEEFSVEKIIAEDPDFIFVIPMGNDEELAMQHLQEVIEEDPAWNDLSAVKNGHYILLPASGFMDKPNARWADSYQYLYNILYGEQ